MDDAVKYAETTKIGTEADYGYTTKDGTCSYDVTKGVAGYTGFTDVTPNLKSFCCY